jgi:hypothetical protein
MDGDSAEQPLAAAKACEAGLRKQLVEFVAGEKAAKRIWNVSMYSRVGVEQRAPEEALQKHVGEEEAAVQGVGGEEEIESDKAPARFENAGDFGESAGMEGKVADGVAGEDGMESLIAELTRSGVTLRARESIWKVRSQATVFEPRRREKSAVPQPRSRIWALRGRFACDTAKRFQRWSMP